jgi:anti-sigma regulatory factor (Ser/Thr protein kinase)
MTQPATGCGASIDLPFDLTPQALEEFDGKVMQYILGDIAAIAINCSRLECTSAAQIALLLRACHMAKHGGAVIALPSAPAGLISVLKAVDVDAYFDADASSLQKKSPSVEPCKLRGQILTHEFTLASESVGGTAAKLASFLGRVAGDTVHAFEWKTIFGEWIAVLRDLSELDSSQQITLIASTTDEQVSVSIIDPGEPLNLCDRVRGIAFEEAIEAQNHPAMSMALVQHLVDGITYERSDGTNTHTLEKCL